MSQFANKQVFRPLRRAWVLIGGLMALGVGAIWACDTPVYRYAMYRWEPAPYELYYFHENPIDESAAKLHQVIGEAAKSEEKPANLFFMAVDVKADPELKTIPRDVRKWWQDQESATMPCYLVVTPYGIPIHSGDLDDASIQKLLDSPARRETFKQMAEGKAGVMLLVTGTDEKANAEAEKLIKEFIGDIASGKIELYLPPTAGFYAPPAEGDEEEPPQPPAIEIGFLKVDRKDPKEKWLIDSLLSMEEDLKSEEFVDKPMMFVVFGRGRALPPCVGKGVNRDNLLDCVDFITGACSCTVKDQNPGMDLLIAADWFKAAETLATKFGAEEGNEYQMAAEDFFPNLIIPDAQPGDAASEDTVGAAPAGSANESGQEAAGDAQAESSGGASDTPADSASATAALPADSPAGGAGAETATASGKAEAGDGRETTQLAARTTPAAANAAAATAVGEVATGGMFRGVFVVGAGVVAAFVLLFGMTFLVLRPR